jgi:hypothetical protein
MLPSCRLCAGREADLLAELLRDPEGRSILFSAAQTIGARRDDAEVGRV